MSIITSLQLMKKCQNGVGNYKGALDDANNLLAECYGTIGRLREDISRCRQQASFCIGDDEALNKKLQRVRDIANESLSI